MSKTTTKLKLSVIFLITDQFDKMLKFYRDLLGFEVENQMENFVEFKSNGIKLEISTNQVLYETTGDKSYLEDKKGQSFELAFLVDAPEAVDKKFEELISKGAVSIKPPEDKPWNQRAGFFADPDGNIHEIYADLK